MVMKNRGILLLGGGFKYFLLSPLFGEDFHLELYFSKGLKPPKYIVRLLQMTF